MPIIRPARRARLARIETPFLFKRELASFLNLSLTATERAVIADPSFPRGIRITERRLAWRRDEVEAWLETRRVPAVDATVAE